MCSCIVQADFGAIRFPASQENALELKCSIIATLTLRNNLQSIVS